jgi:chromosome partitioning protein
MAAILALCSQKGGVSKSTLAQAIAVEAAKAGLAAKIADLDPGQSCSVDWGRDRIAAGIEPAIAVQLYPSVKAALADIHDIDLLVIDGPARADAETLEIARAVDLLVQPSGPSLADLRPGVRTFNSLVKKGVDKRKLLFVLGRMGTEAEAEEARAYVLEAGYRCAPGYIPERTAYRVAQNSGLSITELRGRHLAHLRSQAEALISAVVETTVEASSGEA